MTTAATLRGGRFLAWRGDALTKLGDPDRAMSTYLAAFLEGPHEVDLKSPQSPLIHDLLGSHLLKAPASPFSGRLDVSAHCLYGALRGGWETFAPESFPSHIVPQKLFCGCYMAQNPSGQDFCGGRKAEPLVFIAPAGESDAFFLLAALDMMKKRQTN